MSERKYTPILVNGTGQHRATVSVKADHENGEVEVEIRPADEEAHDQVTMVLDPLSGAALAREIEARSRDIIEQGGGAGG